MPPFSNFSVKAQEAVRKAHELAMERGHNQIDTLHLLAALFLVQDEDNIVMSMLERMEADVNGLTDSIIDELEEMGRGGSCYVFFRPGLFNARFGKSS